MEQRLYAVGSKDQIEPDSAANLALQYQLRVGTIPKRLCGWSKQRFPDRKIIAYPDPTGSARKTSSAGRTDHDIIRRFGFGCISPKAPWAVKDKINATNMMIKSVKGSIRLFVHPRCKHTIKALKNVTFKEGAEDYVIDKTANIEHWTDGLGYLILAEYNPLYERAGRGPGIRLY